MAVNIYRKEDKGDKHGCRAYSTSLRLVTLADICCGLLLARHHQSRNTRSLEPVQHHLVAGRSVAGRIMHPLPGTVADVGDQRRRTAFSVSLLHDRPWDIALAFALLDLAIICPLALIWNGLQRYSNGLSHPGETLLLLAGVYLASAVGGLFSDLILKALGYPTRVSHFISWGISNATGCLAIAPLFIIHRLNHGQWQWPTRQQAFIAAWTFPLAIAIFSCLPVC